jgi:ABC-type sugar transport system ATPase subunit
VNAGAPTSDAVLLRVEGLSKTFGAQRVLDDVSLTIRSGEVHALAGANGSGKSTLIKLLSGFHQPDPGATIELAPEVELHVVHQELGLIPTLDSVENLALGAGYAVSRLGRVRWAEQRRHAEQSIGRFGVQFDVRLPVARLTPAEQTIVAIARALDDDREQRGVLIVDEATAALHENEVLKLFGAIRRLTDRGWGVLFVSHRLQEVLTLCNRVTVLRDGRTVLSAPSGEITEQALVEQIAGRAIEPSVVSGSRVAGAIRLAVRDLHGQQVSGVSFDVHEGEILGVTGLLGSGRDELPDLLAGAAPASAGSVSIDGHPLTPLNIAERIRAGLATVPAHRMRFGLDGRACVRENVVLPQLDPLVSWGRINRRKERQDSSAWATRLEVRPDGVEQPVAQLSGGNQQKVLLARWLRTIPKVLVLAEPTQGVDVGAKEAIHRQLEQAASAGAALVICSGDAKDLVMVCDRVIVLRDGRVAADLFGEELTEHHIVRESVTTATVE